MSDGLIRRLFLLGRLVFRALPGRYLKGAFWDAVLTPLLNHRSFETEATTAFGAVMRGSFPDTIHSRLFYFGIWEPCVTEVFRRTLQPGDIVIDIGANVGAHALLAASLVGPQGRVHAIEASPSTLERLRWNVEANQVQNIVLHHVAVMDRHSRVTVHLNQPENVGGTTVVDAFSDLYLSRATIEASVEARPLGDIVPLDDLLRARIIKIDDEGAEWPVLQGMRDVLGRLRDDVEILIEVAPEALKIHDVTLEDFLGFFESFGFSAYQISNEYDAGYYLNPPPLTLTPYVHRGKRLVDLLMSRRRPSAAA
jgi:FkbM family methyltransferase